ncbi:protein FAR1-RELATED SEQUENCE 11-like, partial [Trifolium medium]|nr:protein FAR1-RELATED SEQUENCE 11-like [Trifolium medium]
MDHESRQVVLGIAVHEVVAEADPVICDPPAIESSQPPAIEINHAPAIGIDTSSSFATVEAFKDRDSLITWVRGVAEKLRFAVVILNSDYGSGRRKQKLVLGCERNGVYKRTSKKIKFEETGTRKCGCKFKLRGNFHVTTNDWHISVLNGIHNHELDKELDGHLVAGRLKPKEMEVVAEMTRNLVPPRNIMTTLKERDPDNVTDIKQLYN